MDVTNIATLITNSGITALLLAVIIAGLIWHRTGSLHTLMNRLWASFNGKKICTVSAIQNALDEQAVLMQFRFTTGLKARTVQSTTLTNETVQKSVSEARWTLFTLLIFFVAGLHFSFRFLQQMINAKDMEKRLAKRRATASC